jgi:hypothetical protein
MKTQLLTSLLIIGLIVITGMITKTKAKTETQKFETLYKEGPFEIRFYPQAIMASVAMEGSYDQSRNSGFRILAGYIFGGNSEKQKIAMTSPVRMSRAEDKNTMSFVLPSKIEFEQLPRPLNQNIILHQSKPVYAAVIQYGGYTSSREIDRKKAELTAILRKLNLEHKPNFEYLGYNPPFQMINRKNEVLVELANFNPERFQR